MLKYCTYIFVCELVILRKSNAIEHAHIRDVDYNPKKQNIIVSMILSFLSDQMVVPFLQSEEEHGHELLFCSNT